MRLRRLLRAQAECFHRLEVAGPNRALTRAASARLLQLVDDVGLTWTREAEGVELAGLGRYVRRSLAAMRVAAAQMTAPGADLRRLDTELRDTGLPLVFFLRGLEGSLLHEVMGAREAGGGGTPAAA
jgi:hypothetical protein